MNTICEKNPLALTTTSAINRNVIFPYAKLFSVLEFLRIFSAEIHKVNEEVATNYKTKHVNS